MKPWREVLEIPPTADLARAELAYKIRARKCHPDAPGGSHDAMAALNAAIDQARKELV